MVSHPRFRQIHAINGEMFFFIIFFDDYKLRSHTADHIVSKISEWDNGWNQIFKICSTSIKKLDKESVIKVRDKLNEINCPYLEENPYLNDYKETKNYCSDCRHYIEKCTHSGIEDIQELYVILTNKCLELSLCMPRFATFNNKKRLTGVTDETVVVRTRLLPQSNRVYNVMTSLVRLKNGLKVRLGNAIKLEVDKIKNECNRFFEPEMSAEVMLEDKIIEHKKGTCSIDWYTEDTWKLIFSPEG